MALKVIGAGNGRTGTLTIKLAHEQLGFGPCHHMLELMSELSRMGHWQELSLVDPFSRVVRECKKYDLHGAPGPVGEATDPSPFAVQPVSAFDVASVQDRGPSLG